MPLYMAYTITSTGHWQFVSDTTLGHRGVTIHLPQDTICIIYFTHDIIILALNWYDTAKYVYFWGAGVINAGSRRGYLEKISPIELCMVDKGFGGRQYQKRTLASNPKMD
jgi:hypothetical protein